MKRRITHLSLTVFAVMLAVSAVAAEGEQGKPRALPVEPIKEFEVVPKGEVINHAFEIRNEGDAALELTDVRPSCGCTVAKYDRKIAPGKTGNVHVTLKTDNFAGPISKAIAVFTNDVANPKLELVVKAHVKPYIQILPGYARYNYVQGEPVPAIPQVLWAEDMSDLKIVDVKPPYDHIKVKFREATDEEKNPKGQGRQWHVEIDLDENAPVGPLKDYVVVTLDHPKQKTAKIPVSGFVRPRQHITPHEVDFGELRSLPLRRTFSFTNFIGEPIELTDIDTGIDAISAEVKPSAKETEQGYRFQLVLTINSKMPKGPFDGEIKIRTTDKKNPVISLPIKGEVL